MIVRTALLIVILLLSACSDVSDLPVTDLSYSVRKLFNGEDDGRTDIVECLQNDGDIVQKNTTNGARCELPNGELIELRDLR